MLYLSFLKRKNANPQGYQDNSFQYFYIQFQFFFREMDKVSVLFPRLFWDTSENEILNRKMELEEQ